MCIRDSDSTLPVNAPLAQWSGYVPPEPPLPTQVLKPSKEEIDAAEKAAQAATRTYHDVESGKANIAFSWKASDRTAAEAKGLIYGDIKGVRVIARDQTTIDKAAAWLAEPGHEPNTDAFWKQVMGYSCLLYTSPSP